MYAIRSYYAESLVCRVNVIRGEIGVHVGVTGAAPLAPLDVAAPDLVAVGHPGLGAGLGSRRERARARHPGLLEHGRTGVEGDAARRRREVRRAGQGRAAQGVITSYSIHYTKLYDTFNCYCADFLEHVESHKFVQITQRAHYGDTTFS